jgi:hypothetical protein
MAFIMPHGIYCYKVMKCLASQIGKNVEAYVDDVVVKSAIEEQLIANLTKTVANL